MAVTYEWQVANMERNIASQINAAANPTTASGVSW
jgi:hypothetical protein